MEMDYSKFTLSECDRISLQNLIHDLGKNGCEKCPFQQHGKLTCDENKTCFEMFLTKYFTTKG